MKHFPVLTLSAALALAACESMNAPLTSSGSFDPLAAAGGTGRSAEGGPTFKPGQFVRAAMDNTAFFAKRPKGDADADKLLARDTQMKVISSDSSYVKVELDSGEVGHVPAVMVNDPNAAVAGVPGPDNQVYPPFPAGSSGAIEPLPVFDTSGLPPDGSVPPVIEPFPTPPAPVPGAPGPAPLPPGIDDVTPSKPEEKKGEPAPAVEKAEEEKKAAGLVEEKPAAQ